MNVAMMQPAFMPWQGLFELIYKSDIFIVLDDFQFSVQSYHQRNRLFIDKGRADWYTVPVLKSVSFGLPLSKTRINEQVLWRQKALKRIQHNYSSAPFYTTVIPEVQKWLLTPFESLSVQNIAFITLICRLIGIEREFRLSSDHPTAFQRSARVVDLLRWCAGSRYYCAKGSFPYMRDEGLFPLSDVETLFQDFQPRAYHQVGSPKQFIPFLSVIDALMNVGPDQTKELIIHGTAAWCTWEQMLNTTPLQEVTAQEEGDEL